MKPITDFLGDFEKLAYKFLMFVIFIPKTLIKIIINPGWASGYIKSELTQKENKFDEYLSPITILLIIAFIPAVIYGLLPPLGVGIVDVPAEKELTGYIVEDMMASDPSLTRDATEAFISNRFLKFEATTTYASGSNEMVYLHSWYIEQFINVQGEYEEIYRANYNSNDYPIVPIDNKTSKDSFYYLFDQSGDYKVNVVVDKFYKDSDVPVESYTSFINVSVPNEGNRPVAVFNSAKNTSGNGNTVGFSDLAAGLKKESNVFLALGLLVPPLVFALGAKLLTRKQEGDGDSEDRETSENYSKKGWFLISENSLKESFFAQCYYFSPIGLSIWASIYSSYYLTPDIFFYKDNDIGYLVIFLPLLLAAIWFIGVETNAIANERNASYWAAFLITLFCIGFLLALLAFVVLFSDLQDSLRKMVIWFYLLGSAGLLIVITIAWLGRKRAENGKITFGEIVILAALLLVILLVGVAFANTPKIPPRTPVPEVDLRSNSAVLITSEPTEPPPEVSASILPMATSTITPTRTPTNTPVFDITGSYDVYSVCGDFTSTGTAEISKGSGNSYEIIFHYPFGDDQGTGEFDGEKFKVWYPGRQALQTFILTPDSILRGTYLDGSRGCSWSDDLVKKK